MNRPLFIVVALLLAASAARADELPSFQAGLHGGYRIGGSLEDLETGEDRDLDDGSTFAVALELRYGKGDDRFYQLWYSLQSTEVDDGLATHDADVEYLHIGGTLPFGGWERVQPYFAAGLGVTRFSASGADTDDRTDFSGSAALGLEIPLAKHAAIRLEARGYLTLVDPDTAFFCRSDNGVGVCAIAASGSSFFQAEGLAGILVRF
ncbi:MAG TPA: outer membrane beta-barrel protein [Steroidobacteraceae bacterium]|nr:outer membrane beta-barrel protein [Steroidobacteraceae bacterium]